MTDDFIISFVIPNDIYMDPRIHHSAESQAADWLISIMVNLYRACQRRAGKATIL